MARYKKKLDDDIRCPLEYGLTIFGGKWKSRIICVLSENEKLRYSELRRAMCNITDAVLASTLKDLIEDDIVVRKSYDEIPPRVEYMLSEKGKSIVPILQNICEWAGIFYKEDIKNEMEQCQKCDHHRQGELFMLTYTEEKKFTKEQVQELFLSVHWVSGNYPERLYKALMHSSTVLTVWDGEKLVGLTRVIDDTEMLAQIHYVLVHPDYQGMGIAGKMIEYIKEKYKDFLYIEGMPEDKNNVPFYVKHGFTLMEDGAAIQICNYNNQHQFEYSL